MSLIGNAVVAIWNDILPEGRENFIQWHNREHIPERIAIDGFHRGRRFVAAYGAPEYFTLYEARDTGVLVGSAYLERLNNPTEWTKRSTADFRNTARGVCETVWSAGQGEGGHMLTLRFDARAGSAASLRRDLADAGLPPLALFAGINGVHLCIADQDASSLETAERKGRDVGVPRWIVMIEGGSAQVCDAAADRLLADGGLEAAGARDIERGLYQLEFSLQEEPFAYAERKQA